MIQFHVPGRPQPAGSKRGFRRPGSPTGVIITDDNRKAKPWQAAVSSEARLAYQGELLRGALRVTITFYLARPKGHFGKKGVRPAAPGHPTVKPDVLKLARAVEDAITGIIWHDDAQIVVEQLEKVYSDQDGCTVVVEEMAA